MPSRQCQYDGFRKVHPDRWEFAHESFLRGQTHLLPRIVRRKKRGEGGGGGAASCSSTGGDAARRVIAGEDYNQEVGDDDDHEERGALLEEVQRLRKEQAAIGEELAQMSRRLQATERRPDQLMSFLARLADDPDGVTRHLVEQAAEKKRRRMGLSAQPIVSPLPRPLPPAPPPPPPVMHHHPMLAALGGGVVGCDEWQWAEQKPAIVLPSFEPNTPSYCGVQQVPDFGGGGGGGGMGLIADDTAVETPFPFCLLGQGFF
nr:unnamed protein product [Digitaria exilis]